MCSVGIPMGASGVECDPGVSHSVRHSPFPRPVGENPGIWGAQGHRDRSPDLALNCGRSWGWASSNAVSLCQLLPTRGGTRAAASRPLGSCWTGAHAPRSGAPSCVSSSCPLDCTGFLAPGCRTFGDPLWFNYSHALLFWPNPPFLPAPLTTPHPSLSPTPEFRASVPSLDT